MLAQQVSTNEYQDTLAYYKQKVEGLETERQAWLSKFDQCSQKLNHKQQKQEQLRSLKDQIDEAQKDILHHQVACFDQRLNALNLDRNNQNLEFQEAEQLVKLRELAEEFPTAVANVQKQLPCLGKLSGDIIQNDLNIHSNSNGKNVIKKTVGSGKKSLPEKKDQQSKNTSVPKKKTLDQLLKLKIIETNKLNEQELQIMEFQEELLEKSIKEYKEKQKQKVNGERDVVKQFNKKYKELEQKHKKLAEGYFEYRRKHKQKIQNTRQENKQLKNTFDTLEAKVAGQIKVYEKENKAKQALILRKSEDFQEDYKARMRAKERNLQALKQNYEKMQQMCIEKIRKLEATVERARYQLQDAEEKRNFLLTQLRQQLRGLQKRCYEQRIQKARLDIKLKKKMEEERQKIEQQQEREEQMRKAQQKEQMLKTAYKKTGIPKKTVKNMKKTKQNKKASINNAESSGDEDSLQISDIENIRKQINDLEKKIASDER